MIALVVLSASILLQFTAAGIAFRLIWVTGWQIAWSSISVALALMSLRRCITLYRVLAGDQALSPDITAELVALTISVLMVAGMALIAPLFARGRKAEEALRESEEKFRTVVNRSPAKIHIKDVEGRYLLVNKEAEALFGVTDEEARGKTTFDLFPGKQAEAFLAHDKAVVETGQVIEDEEEFVREDGVHTFLTVKFPIHDVAGKIVAIGAIGTDITERKRAQEALERLKQQNELLLSSAGEGIYGLDTQGRTTFVNPAAAMMIGWKVEELIDKPQHDILHHTKPDGSPYPREECPIYAAFKDGSVHHVTDEVFWRKDGSSFPVEYVSTPIRERGEITGAVVIFRDITERKRAEKLSQRLGRILDSSFNEIYVFDARTYRFTQVNQGAQNNLGYTMEELRGLTPWDLKPAFDEKSFGAMVEPLHRGEKDLLVFETDHRRKDGSLYPVEIRLQLSRTEKPPVFVAIIADITERKLAEDAVHAAKEQAEVANRAKSEFLANMSHELRTPLNAILGFAEIIKTETFGPVGNPKYVDYVHDIHSSAYHLLELINDVLDLSKVESGTDELHEEDISVPEVARFACRFIQQRADENAIKLNLELSDELPTLCADERKLKQILINLLSNAIKFTDPGGEVTLKAWCRSDSGYVFQVSDNGIGIAPEDIPKVLTQFGQVESTFNRRREGTGLGLPLAKSFVELHGGSFDLQSEPGVGTTVTVRFPARRIARGPHGTQSSDIGGREAG